jgi:hypothetical protein
MRISNKVTNCNFKAVPVGMIVPCFNSAVAFSSMDFGKPATGLW